MNTTMFDSKFQAFVSTLRAETAQLRYSGRSRWKSIGTHAIDARLSDLADFYRRCNSVQRRTLRGSLNPATIGNLLFYVRRMSIQIMETVDPIWLVRALAAASLENAQCDYRDSIVSLVIARAGAEAVSIDSVPHFNYALSRCDPVMVPIFSNARDHQPKDVRDILREFGPPELQLKRRQKIS